MRRALFLLLPLVLFGAPACSSDDGGQLEATDFCDRLLELDADAPDQVQTTDPGDLDPLFDRLDEVADIAPDEVKDELRLIADANRFEVSGGERPESLDDLDDQQLHDQLEDAYVVVSQYLADQCDIRSGVAATTTLP